MTAEGLVRWASPRPAVRHWSIRAAFEVFGLPLPSTRSRERKAVYTAGSRISGLGRRPYHDYAEDLPGGRAYLYETARELYRRRVLELHPDVGGDPEKMLQLRGAMDYIERRYGPRRFERYDLRV